MGMSCVWSLAKVLDLLLLMLLLLMLLLLEDVGVGVLESTLDGTGAGFAVVAVAMVESMGGGVAKVNLAGLF